MSKELYRAYPWLTNLTGRNPNKTGDEIHTEIRDKSAAALRNKGVGKPDTPPTPQASGAGVTYSADGKRYTDSNGVSWDLATGQAINPKTNKIGKHGYSIDPKSGERFDTPAPSTGDPAPPASVPPTAPAPSTGRNTDAPDGSDAKGTNTGYKIDLNAANGLLGGFGVQMADANSFLSEQLPVSASEKPVIPQESLTTKNPAELAQLASSSYDQPEVVEGVSVAGQREKPFTSPVETADNNRAISVPGEQPTQTKRGPIRGAVDSRFDDGAEYGESYAVEKTPGRAMFSSTFLSGDGDSMAALRRAEASVGKFVQGGTVYANDGGTLREISKEAGDKMNTGTLSAQEFKDSFVGDVKQTLVPVDTPDITSTRTPGSNKNYDDGDFSVDDAVGMGMSQEDAETIASGGQVETVFTPNPGTESEFTDNNSPPSGGDTYFGGKAQAIRNMRDKYFDK